MLYAAFVLFARRAIEPRDAGAGILLTPWTDWTKMFATEPLFLPLVATFLFVKFILSVLYSSLLDDRTSSTSSLKEVMDRDETAQPICSRGSLPVAGHTRPEGACSVL